MVVVMFKFEAPAPLRGTVEVSAERSRAAASGAWTYLAASPRRGWL